MIVKYTHLKTTRKIKIIRIKKTTLRKMKVKTTRGVTTRKTTHTNPPPLGRWHLDHSPPPQRENNELPRVLKWWWLCATHHTKLVRRVVKRRLSCVDKCGAIKWTMGEATILDFPSSAHSQRCVSENTSEATILPEKWGTNTRTRLLSRDEADQSEENQLK